jgi:4a-hydroxytetrahydrobiopterin dehydratase
MTTLANCNAGSCSINAPTVTEDEKRALLPQIPDWNIIVIDDIERLTRAYPFPDFATAMQFANAVGDLAEAEGHHPALLIEWGKVEVSWWSHKIRGLHQSDFVYAARCDQLYTKT